MRKKAPFLEEAQSYLKADDLRDIKDAYLLAQELYGSCSCHPQGESCIVHAGAVATLLLPKRPDAHTLIACLLQCARSPEKIQKIEERFGKDIASTVASLSILHHSCGHIAPRSPETLRRIIFALSKNIRILLLALHIRWYTLQKADRWDQKSRALIAREALDVFAPLCARLGIYSLKYELETLAFQILYPEDASMLLQKLEKLRQIHGPFLAESKRILGQVLAREGKQAMILTREKHPYSLYRKLHRKALTNIRDLHDLFGMRVLVDTPEECYEVLGIIHRTYRPIPHRMKDYIAMPKPNGYRSIHTTVLGLSAEDPALPVEIQIRTHAMDEEAEYGIAAHWNYKQRGSQQPFDGTSWQKRLETLNEETEKENADDEDLAEEFSDRIFVLTPNGDVVELPKGAGPLDFAFRVHTDVGLRYRHAKVNGAIAPISEPLENGDMVQVTIWSEPKPSSQWMQHVKTKEARQKLRTYFREKSPVQSPHFVESKQVPRSMAGIPEPYAPPTVRLESGMKLPYDFARCCRPDQHRGQRPPIVGFITRNGMVRLHWSGCRMILSANHERLVRASWTIPEAASEVSPPSSVH